MSTTNHLHTDHYVFPYAGTEEYLSRVYLFSYIVLGLLPCSYPKVSMFSKRSHGTVEIPGQN